MSDVRIGLKAAQFLCSRLCHDLVGPISAINAGLELLEDASVGPPGADGTAAAIGLTNKSAGQAAHRLSFFRMAFGMGGDGNSASRLDEGRTLAQNFLLDGNVSLDWPANAGADETSPVPAACVKLTLNMILLGIECLPRGGVVSARFGDLPEGLGIALTASGRGCRFKDDLRFVMSPDPDPSALDARNIHAHFCACLAASLGGAVEVQDRGDGTVQIAALAPFG